MVHLLKKKSESGRLVPGMSSVWEDIDSCTKEYRCDLYKYWRNMLSSSYGIVMDRAINAPVCGNNVVDGLN